jgi:ATP-dependent RNA helicase DeaD
MSNTKFQEFNLSKELLRAVSDMGFEETTPIQTKAIPEIILGKDVIGQASTGTGKTAAFGLPAIEKIDEDLKAVQVIVLCPTRELAIQVSSEMNKFLKYKKNISSLPVYGGQPIQRQFSGLKRLPRIIVGTPGRTLDHIERGTLKLDKVKMVILDEADEMLDMGFRVDIQKILKSAPKERQTLLFSATMSREVLDLTRKFQNNPEMIKVASENLNLMIKQSYFDVEPSRKTQLLAQLLTEYNPKLSIVFCNTKRKVDKVSRDLRSQGFYSDVIHGGIRQTKRDKIMNKFRNNKVNVLVATDVAARGIDVSDIDIIFNYGIPRECESYVHRIGRTGRAGKTGKAISFVSRTEFGRLRNIMRFTKADIECKKVDGLPDLEFLSKKKEKNKEQNKTQDSVSIDQFNSIGRINDRIKKIKKDELSKYLLMMNDLVDDYNSIENVTAALLKMAVEKEVRPRGTNRSRSSGRKSSRR